MIAITKIKIDNRGRITLPDTFLKANKIKKESFVEVYPVYNREDSIRIQFEMEDKDNEENR